jgi:hypothetical protein
LRPRAFFLSMGLLLISLLLMGCSPFQAEPPAIGTVTLTEKIDEHTKAPLGTTVRFPAGSKVIYLSAQVTHPRPGTKLEARWLYDREGSGQFHLIDGTELTFPAKGDRYAAFRLAAKDAFPSGQYKVELYLEGQKVKELPFPID